MLTVRVGWLRSCRGASAILGFVALGVDSLLDCVRDANFLVGITWGEPGTGARACWGRTYEAGKPARRVRDTPSLLGLTLVWGVAWPLPGFSRAELTA